MENLTSVWLIGLMALVAGVLIGALAYRLFSSSKDKTEQIRSELDETRDELSAYKASVQTHFDKTSELVNELTQNYARVYQHLAEGAHTLGDSQALNNLLEQQPGRVVIAVDEETAESDPLAEELAAAQAQASIDLPLGEEPAAAEMDVAVSTESGKGDDIDLGIGEPEADEETRAAAAEQVAWEPTSPMPAAETADEAPAAEQSADTGSAESPFDATQKFVSEGENEAAAAEIAQADASAPADETTATDSNSEDSPQKSKQKEAETA